jgi:hypothetical protein
MLLLCCDGSEGNEKVPSSHGVADGFGTKAAYPFSFEDRECVWFTYLILLL